MIAFLLALFLVQQTQPPPVLRLYPVDDAARDHAFRSYLGKLRAAVAARNTRALRKLVDEQVVVGPDDDDKGWTKFVAKWHPDDAEGSPLWPALADLLSLGFVREHPSLFLSPYVVWRFPQNLDRAGHLVVIRDKVPLRESPSLNAPSVATLSFDIVLRLGSAAASSSEGLQQWVHVRTLDGRTGYVTTRDVMRPDIPRAQFSLREGRWVMSAMEGGDS